MRRSAGGRRVLNKARVRQPKHAHTSVTERLLRKPFHGIIPVVKFILSVQSECPFTFPCPPKILGDHGISIRDQFREAAVERICFQTVPPVRCPVEDSRPFSFFRGQINIRSQTASVPHDACCTCFFNHICLPFRLREAHPKIPAPSIRGRVNSRNASP